MCLTGWEPLDSSAAEDRERRFEAIWSVEPDVVRQAAVICAWIADAARPALLDPARRRLESPPSLSPASQLRLATAVTARMLSHVSTQLILAPGTAA
jgi:DICT domain-containing protein